jgi:hypothetical protein
MRALEIFASPFRCQRPDNCRFGAAPECDVRKRERTIVVNGDRRLKTVHPELE